VFFARGAVEEQQLAKLDQEQVGQGQQQQGEDHHGLGPVQDHHDLGPVQDHHDLGPGLGVV
jgi:hypothetical protein